MMKSLQNTPNKKGCFCATGFLMEKNTVSVFKWTAHGLLCVSYVPLLKYRSAKEGWSKNVFY